MSYFETTKIKNGEGEIINPAQDESLTMLKRIFQALKPLGQITGAGSNRLSIDVNNLAGGSLATINSVNTVTTVTTTGTINNLAGVGGVAAFDLMKTQSRTAFNTGNRSNISF